MKGLKFIWSYVKAYWILLIIITIFILTSTYLQVIAPKLLGNVFEDLVKYVTALNGFDSNTKAAITEAGKEVMTNNFFRGLMTLLFVYAGTFVVMFLQNIFMTIVSGKSANQMRISLFKKMENLSVRFFDTHSDGELISRFTNDIDNISNALNQGIVQVVSNVAVLIGYTIMMYQESFTFATLIVGVGLIALFASQFILLRARRAMQTQQQTLGELNGYINEKVNGQKEIIAYNLKDEMISDFNELNERYRKSSVSGEVYAGLLFPVINGLGMLTTAIFVLVGGYAVMTGDLSIALFVAFVQYTQRFFQPLTQISSQYNLMQLAVIGASRVAEIFDVKKEVQNRKDAFPINELSGKLEMKNVTFGYNPDVPVLKNINIEVKKGEMVALVGPTGSGKTTIMNVLNRFYDIQEGEILYDGQEIQTFEVTSLRRNVGIVLQESVLFSGTIRENIAYGKEDATEEEIINTAKLANLHDFIMELPEQYDTYVTDATSIFSTGQKQLMSIARTILTDPDLLILDEATSNVDTVTEAKIQKAMNNVLQDRTSFVIAHRLKTILDADKIIVLKDGEIIESGNHHSLLQLGGFYAELYHNQFVLEQSL
ncbi:MAG: ABC transporter ATP-binding protein [Culicoidibacterales bacterium]